MRIIHVKMMKLLNAVAYYIRVFEFKVPTIIDKDNVIVASHTRLKAAIKIGLDEVLWNTILDVSIANINGSIKFRLKSETERTID